jgi:hypothetical protein
MSRGFTTRVQALARALVIVATSAALALGGGCTSRDSTYCDQQVACIDPDFPICNQATRTCERAPQADAGADAARDGAADTATAEDAGDGGGEDGGAADDGGTDGGADGGADGGTDGGPVPDGGCTSPLRECAGGCYSLYDPAYCGPACTPCSAPASGHPTCDGTSCDFACNTSFWRNNTTCEPCNTTTHCGASCATCSPPQHSQATCNGTACDFSCDSAHWRDGSACDPCDNAGHCGTSCVACTGSTPSCQGGLSGRCECTSSSCGGPTPICDGGSGQCRACAEHTECASGACETNGACVAAADIIYVDGSAGCPGAGTEQSPLCTFPPALDLITSQRWRIVVRAGTYTFNATQTIASKKVGILGAGAGTTALVLAAAANEHVIRVSGTSDLRLYGLTIRGATGTSGHGVFCYDATATPVLAVDACTVSNNVGVGILVQHGTATVSRSTVTLNSSSGIVGNGATLTVSKTLVSDNSGGGIYAHSGSTASIEQCTVRNNNGGGLALYSSYTVRNTLIVKNGRISLTTGAAGADLRSTGSPKVFINNTVADNIVGTGGIGGVLCTGAEPVVNSILWGNTVAQQSGCTISYSDVQGGGTADGNINGDPKFADATNYHLQMPPNASPCINAGTPTGAPTVDLDGFSRSGNPDMGCYEAH